MHASLATTTASTLKYWQTAYWALLVIWIGAVALAMGKVAAGFVTNYVADLTFPPWYYITIRGLYTKDGTSPRLLRWFGRSPERTAGLIFGAGVAYEFIQLRWPDGLFRGTYDPWDIAAYGVGLVICWILDRRQIARRSSNQ